MHKPRRRRASFNPNTRIVFRMTPHSPLDWFRLRMALTASEPVPSSVNHADRRQLLRNIQTNESGHRAPPMCEPPSDSAWTAALWAVSGSGLFLAPDRNYPMSTHGSSRRAEQYSIANRR
jgi:hypothetical protein